MALPDRPRILVVDDEIGFRELCTDLLEEEGYETESSANGREALDALSKKPGAFQLVLSDINMPVVDGLQFLRAAKEAHPELVIILMTAYGGLQSALEALRYGAYDYITKPFTRDGLLASVNRGLEKGRLSHDLKAAQGDLVRQEKLATLGSMSGWLAHRMRNPLNVILMCSQYLKTKFESGDERRDVAVAIEDKVKTLEKMTRDFIQFSRSYEPRLQPENMEEVWKAVLEAFASRMKIQGVELETSFASRLPPVPMDRDLVEEVFGYLVDNALEAVGGKGAVFVRALAEGSKILVDVCNTGASIPQDVREKLFEPFFTTKERGTGLGLAIARRVIESHGGKVYLLEGEKTTFRIELPAETPPPPGDEKKPDA
jgi:signal transduction histidine kinase